MNAIDYRHIAAWGKMMGSFAYFVRCEQAKAARDNAPIDAVYKREGVWITIRDCAESTQRDIANILERGN